MADDLFFRLEIDGLERDIRSATDLRKVIADINQQLRETNDSEAYKTLEADLLKAKAQLGQVNREQREAVKQLQAADTGVGSYRRLNAELVEARRKFKELGEAEREGQPGRELLETIKQLDTELKTIDASIGQFQRNVGNYPTTIREAVGETIPLFGTLFTGLEQIGQQATRTGKLISRAFLAFALASEVAAAVGEVREFVEEFRNLRGEISQLTNATGEGLDIATTKTVALAETFNKTTDEITLAANALSKQFNIPLEEAFVLLEKGFLAGADASGDFLSQVQEYPTFFREAGFAADEFVGIITRQVQEGIFSDKGIDAIKEAELSLRELTQPTLDALNAIGLTGETIRDVIGEQGIGAAIQLVSSRLGDFEDDSVEVGRVLADVFKGAGEDAGVEFIKSLAEIDGNLDEVIDSVGDYATQQEELLRVNEALAAAQNEVAKRFEDSSVNFEVAGKRIKTFFINSLVSIIDTLQPVFTAFGRLFRTLGDLGERLFGFNDEAERSNAVITLLQAPLNLLAFILENVANFLTRVVDGVSDFIDNSPLAQRAVEGIRTAFQGVVTAISNIPALFSGVVAAARQAGQNVANFFRRIGVEASIFAKEVEQFFTIGRDASDRLQDEIDALRAKKEELKDTGQSVGEAFREAFDEQIAQAGEQAVATVQQTQADIEAATTGGRPGAGGGVAATDQGVRAAQEREKAQQRLLEQEERFGRQRIDLIRELGIALIEQEIANIEDQTQRALAAEVAANAQRLEEIDRQEAELVAKLRAQEARFIEVFGEGSEELATFRANANQDLLVIQEQSNGLREEEERRHQRALLDIEEEGADQRKRQRLENLQEELESFRQNREQQLLVLREQLARGIITEEAFGDQSFQVARESLREQIAAIQEDIDGVSLAVVDGEATQGELDELIRQRQELNTALAELEEERTEKVNEEVEKRLQAQAQEFIEVTGFVSQFFDQLGQFIEAGNERNLASIDELTAVREENIAKIDSQLENANANEIALLNKRKKAEERALASLTTQREQAQEEFAKKQKSLAVIQAIISGAQGIVKTGANLGYPAAIPFQIAQGIQTAAQIAIINAQPLADGGVVSLSGERVNVAPNIRPTRKGDNVLAVVKRGEVVLNRRQQRRLGGSRTFRAIGVPGFADGGAIDGDPVIGAPNVSGIGSGGLREVIMALDAKTDAIDKRIDRLEVILPTQKLQADNDERDTIEANATLG